MTGIVNFVTKNKTAKIKDLEKIIIVIPKDADNNSFLIQMAYYLIAIANQKDLTKKSLVKINKEFKKLCGF